MYRSLTLVAAFVSLAACSAGPRVRADVARGNQAGQLSIRLSSSDSELAPVPVDLVQINLRHSAKPGGVGQVIWKVVHRPGTPALRLPALVPYGVVPSGYYSSGPAPMLATGDYEVRVNAGGAWSVTPFRITALNVIE